MEEIPPPLSLSSLSQVRTPAQSANPPGADEGLQGEIASGSDNTADIHEYPGPAMSHSLSGFHLRSQDQPAHPSTFSALNSVETPPRISFPLTNVTSNTSFVAATSGPSSFLQSLANAPSHPIEPLQIILSDDKLVCRGVGSNMEDALLSGHVVLNLTESTIIKEISLQLTGTVRLTLGESMSSVVSHTIYTHGWTLMEHKHTIKEGRHVFPFQHSVPASLPVSMNIPYAGAEVYYKLRATAVRSSFHSNWTAVRAVFLMRMFNREAVEFSQVLEIENTWPEKMMYSILIPHKSFAAGDTIPSLVRFQPISKGVSVKSISIEVKEAVFSRWKTHPESRTSRLMASVQYIVEDGKAVKVMEGGVSIGVGTSGGAQGEQGPSFVNSSRGVGGSATSTPIPPPNTRSQPHLGLSNVDQAGASSSTSPSYRNPPRQGSLSTGHIPALHSIVQGATPTGSVYASRRRGRGGRTFSASTMFGGVSENNESPSPGGTPNHSPRPSGEHIPFQHQPAPSAPDTQPASSQTSDERLSMSGNSDIEAKLYLHLPIELSPSQSFPSQRISDPTNAPTPIAVLHKVSFSVLISNLDGHTSELKCSLPLHVLDPRLLSEARAATRVTRNVLLGRREEDEGGEFDGEEEEEEVELPSYNEHILDRVANASLEPNVGRNGRLRLGNMAMNSLGSLPPSLTNSPVLPEWHGTSSAGGYFGPHHHYSSYGNSNRTTPFQSMPGSPVRSGRPSLEEEPSQDRDLLQFDQELMVSLGQVANANSPTWGFGGVDTRSGRASTSRMGSRVNSRAASPEPSNDHCSPSSHGRHSSSTTCSTSGSSSRGLFHLKPFSSIAKLSGHHSKKDREGDKNHSSSGHLPRSSSSRNCSTVRDIDGEHAHQQHIHPLTQVPSYGISSRGFLGGGPPPLTFYRDLPSYDQSESANLSAHRDLSSPSGAYGSVLERSRSEASLMHPGNLMSQLETPQTP